MASTKGRFLNDEQRKGAAKLEKEQQKRDGMTKVINFFGGPSAGKTTNALEFASMLKKARLDVTYVPEVAYEKVLDENYGALDDQLFLLGEQAHRLYRVKDKFDWVVTDAPLILMIHYIEKSNKKFGKAGGWKAHMNEVILQTFDQYENYNFFVERGDRKFLQMGRVQDEAESREIDGKIQDIMNYNLIPYQKVKNASEVWTHLANRGVLNAA